MLINYNHSTQIEFYWFQNMLRCMSEVDCINDKISKLGTPLPPLARNNGKSGEIWSNITLPTYASKKHTKYPLPHITKIIQNAHHPHRVDSHQWFQSERGPTGGRWRAHLLCVVVEALLSQLFVPIFNLVVISINSLNHDMCRSPSKKPLV